MATYRLAEKLHMIREEMLERMSAVEVHYWLALMMMDSEQMSGVSSAKTPSSVQQQSPDQIVAALRAASRKAYAKEAAHAR